MQYKTIHVSASRCYDIHIGRGLLAKLGDFVRPLLGECRIAVLTDSNVDALYGNSIVENLAGGRLVDIHNTPGNSGFAGAGLAHQTEYLTLPHLKGHIIHRFDDGMFAQFEHMGKVLNIQ